MFCNPGSNLKGDWSVVMEMQHANSEKDLIQMEKSSNDSINKLFMVVAVVALVLAFAAFVVGVVSLSRQNSSPASASSPSVINIGTFC